MFVKKAECLSKCKPGGGKPGGANHAPPEILPSPHERSPIQVCGAKPPVSKLSRSRHWHRWAADGSATFTDFYGLHGAFRLHA